GGGVGGGGPQAFYEGEVARAVCDVTGLEEEDLASFRPRWVEPLRVGYRGHGVLELPPPTQGVAALEGLGLLERGEPSLVAQVECCRLALEDAFVRVRDGEGVRDLIAPDYLHRP